MKDYRDYCIIVYDHNNIPIDGVFQLSLDKRLAACIRKGYSIHCQQYNQKFTMRLIDEKV